MNDFNDLIKSAQFTVQEASFAKVGDFWKDMVYFYQHNRIYYVTEGSAELFLKRTKLTLTPFHLYFIPGYSVVTAKCDCILSHYYVHFELDSILASIFDSFQFNLEIEGSQEDERIFRLIMENINSASLYSLLTINGSLQVLLAKFFRGAKFINPDILRFNEVISYIKNNVTKKITVKELASIANLNEVYFSNLFSKTMGISPLQFILNKKINHSMMLLKNKGYSVKEVAMMTGFSDELYFSRLFKQKIGVSPAMFKNSASENTRKNSGIKNE